MYIQLYICAHIHIHIFERTCTLSHACAHANRVNDHEKVQYIPCIGSPLVSAVVSNALYLPPGLFQRQKTKARPMHP